MTFRPFVVFAALLFGLILALPMLITEETGQGQVAAGPTQATTDPLKILSYTTSSRKDDFIAMGLPEDMAVEATEKAVKIRKSRGELLTQMMDQPESKELATRILCVSTPMTPRYAAVQLIVVDGTESRSIVDATDLNALVSQDWYNGELIEQVYRSVDKTNDRKADATAMGIAAILMKKEDDAIDRVSPWGEGSMLDQWSLSNVRSAYGDQKIHNKMVDYFALMHVLTEIANDDKGVCN